MASKSIAKRPNGKWRARYRDDAGKEHARHFGRKIDAQRWLDEATASIVRGDWADPRAGKETLRAYAARWESIQVGSESSASIVDNALRLHILPRLGDLAVAAIRRSDVQAAVKAWEQVLAPSTVRIVYGVLQRVLEAATDDRRIPRSPCTRITLPKDHDEEVVVPTVEQVDAIRAAFVEQFRILPVFLAGTGLRIGELLGLQLGDVDFLRRTLRVERQRRQDGTLGPVKSKTSKRTVPIGKVVLDELALHLTIYPANDRGLFPDVDGSPLTYRRWRTLLDEARRTSQVDVTAHSFRHYCASALISGGASVKQVQTFLGHASPVITLEVYGHLFPGDDDRTRNVLDDALKPLATAVADSVRTEEVAT